MPRRETGVRYTLPNSPASKRQRALKIGEATAGQVEILDGLEPGDRIAVAGVTFLQDGMKVRDLGAALRGS